MKNYQKILFIIILIISIFWINDISASNIQWLTNIDNETQKSSINISWTDANSIWKTIETVWFRVLTIVKYIFSWVLLIFLVYAWAKMIMSMWTDDDSLSKAKKTIWYSMIWLIFINIPWTIATAIQWSRVSVAWWIWSSWSNELTSTSRNLFMNTEVFTVLLNDYIIRFIQITLVAVAIMVIILAWIKIMTSRWREEKITEAKNKIIWSVVWLIFIWFIEAWLTFAYWWSIQNWKDIFKTIANLLLFLAPPIAIFFLTLAWYYYITSNWDEEKMKKWKNIVINTMLWTVILLISYIFLNDLIKL